MGIRQMYADVPRCALSCACHRAQVIKTGPARGDHERRAMREKRELGSWGLFRTVGDKQPFIAQRVVHFVRQRRNMVVLTQSV